MQPIERPEQTERPREGLATQAIEDFVAFNACAGKKIKAGVAAADDFAGATEVARVRAKFA